MADFVPSTCNAIAYYRVSTARQGQSGLGLAAQRASVENYAKRNGLSLAAEYVEVETGTKKRERVVIREAIREARAQSATLLIAKLDRLARNVAFISALQESAIDFVAVDMPHANKLTVHIMAAIAEHEAELISKRTKAALAAAKARGTQLGSPDNLTRDAALRGAQANHTRAVEAYRTKSGYCRLLREKGLTYQQIADTLNMEGHLTRRGKQFTPMTVYRMLGRVVSAELS